MLWTISVTRLIEQLARRPGDGADFLDKFGTFTKRTLDGLPPIGAYENWIRRRVDRSGHYSGVTDPQSRMRRDAGLIADIREHGMRAPLVSSIDEHGYQIDGWHRLVIAHALGQREVLVHRHENEDWVASAGHRAPLTLLLAHPDDEIFLWPFLATATRIVACVSDEENPERPAWNRRLEAFHAVCAELGVQSHNLGLASGLYRMPRPGIENFGRELSAAIAGQIVATHNSWGEYGHPDHILCHQVARASARMTLATNIRLQRDWLPIAGRAGDTPRLNLGRFHRDRDLFERVRAIYARYIPWPADIPVANECEVYVC